MGMRKGCARRPSRSSSGAELRCLFDPGRFLALGSLNWATCWRIFGNYGPERWDAHFQRVTFPGRTGLARQPRRWPKLPRWARMWLHRSRLRPTFGLHQGLKSPAHASQSAIGPVMESTRPLLGNVTDESLDFSLCKIKNPCD